MYKILKAKKSDFLFVSNLLTELYGWLSKFSKHTFDAKNEISYEEYINNLNDFYVLKNESKLFGVMASKIRDIITKNKIQKRTFFIYALIVNEKFRNQNGGSALINHVLKIKEKEKIDNIRLRVLAKNKIAYNFYLKNGFVKKSEVLEYINNNKNLKSLNNANFKEYKVELANNVNFKEIKDLMKFRENRVIDTHRNILNDCTNVIKKKEFNNYLKDNLIFVIKLKLKIIGVLGVNINFLNNMVFVKREELNINFLLIDKNYNDNFDFEKNIIFSFFNHIKEIAKNKNIKIIKLAIYPNQKSIYNILRLQGFNKFSFDMEKCI